MHLLHLFSWPSLGPPHQKKNKSKRKEKNFTKSFVFLMPEPDDKIPPILDRNVKFSQKVIKNYLSEGEKTLYAANGMLLCCLTKSQIRVRCRETLCTQERIQSRMWILITAEAYSDSRPAVKRVGVEANLCNSSAAWQQQRSENDRAISKWLVPGRWLLLARLQITDQSWFQSNPR